MCPSNGSGPAPRRLPAPALFLYPLAHLVIEFYNSQVSMMWPLFAAKFGLTYGTVGLLSNVLFRGAMTLPQLGFAPITDRHGSRWLAIVGVLVMGAGMSLLGLAPSVAVLAAILVLAPLGSAAFHPAGTAYMGKALARQRGIAVALFMIGGTLGMSLGPLLGGPLYQRYGLRASPWLIPFALGIALLMFLFIPADRQATTHRAAGAGPRSPIPRAIFVLMVACICQAWIENAFTQYLPLFLTAQGLPLTRPGQILSIYQVMAAAGVLAGGALSDRMPRWRVAIVAMVLTMPAYLATLRLGGTWALIAPGALGFAAALSHPVTVTMGQELMPDRTSLASALTMGISWVIGSLGAFGTGVLADHIGIETALLLNTALPLIGISAVLTFRQLSRRQRALGGQAQKVTG